MVRRAVTILFCLLVATLLCTPAAPGQAVPRDAHHVVIEAGSGRLLALSAHAANIFAADPKVAEVRAASPTSLFVFGVAPGHTTVVAIDADGNSIGRYTVEVVPSTYASQAGRHVLSQSGLDGIRMQQGNDSITLSGVAPSPAGAQEAVTVAQDALGRDGHVVNHMRVNGSIQVNLRVRIAEMSRILTRQLGINWQSVNALGTQAAIGVSTAYPAAALAQNFGFLSRFKIGGHATTLDTVIDALSEDQLIHMLAEPNLTTMSGEPASFLAGGEFPVPVSGGLDSISVEYKQYGISLSFVPTVLDDGQISLHVRPEVSALTNQGAVSISSGNSVIQIPALTVRRVDTTVELGSGQSFAIAGLLQENTTDTGSGVPFLGDVPVLGALFHSDSFLRNQSELVIVVTPYIVRPVDTAAALRLPTDDWQPPSDLERILLLRQNGRAHAGINVTASPVHIPGDAGFIVE
ncbi:type II and III secretion system protein family protein [Lichenicoccus roseus]|uniref:Type II and III secretion system protein family protein n=1 Tax=Lichenicoccus roseus TaxID=2683649 RepID=A0A5R9JAT1_9PROT|nr:type II and III secretion system protein family protein [Lichenicoccus roseus]TLU72711.1 type II and III secretion system protein family protein [Lichenicoccus roseus]